VRVGLVCPYSLTLPGGVQGQVLGLARMLRLLGVEARVLGPCDGPPPDPSVTPLGNSIPTSANGSMAAVAPDPAASLRTIRSLRDEAFDIVHLHEPIVPGPTLTALVFCDSPMVGTFHRAGQSNWYHAVRWSTRWTTDNLRVRVAVSEEAAVTAQATLGGEDYRVLWNGIDVAVYDRARPWPTVAPTIFFLGRHEPRKGLEVLVEAFGDLPDDTRLWIAGDGPQTAQLQERTRGNPRIEWLGVIAEDEKVARMRGADVFCAPSTGGESFGVVLLEALAADTAVVASDLDGYRNVVRNGREGILVPPGSAPALAAGLRRALAGGPAVAGLVAQGARRADELSLRRLAQRYIAIYEEVLAATPTGPPRSPRPWRPRRARR
jgi:phosphatidylinositol alpha-mannosyltransferase